MNRSKKYGLFVLIGGLGVMFVAAGSVSGADLFQATDDGTAYAANTGVIRTGSQARVNTTEPDVYWDFHLEVSVGPEEVGVIGTEVFGTEDPLADLWVKEEGVSLLEGVLLDPGVVNGFLEAIPQGDNGWMRIVGEIEVTAVDSVAFPSVSVGDTLEYSWDFYPFDEPVSFGLFSTDWSSHSDLVTVWVPEPASLMLLGCGGLVMVGRRRSR